MRFPTLNRLTSLPLATRLLFWFLLISVVPLSIVLYMTYTVSEKSLSKELGAHLQAIADGKGRLLEGYASERTMDVSTLAVAPHISAAMEAFSAALENGGTGSPDYQQVVAVQEPPLQRYIEASGYEDILLISSNGIVLFSSQDPSISGSNLTGSVQNEHLFGVFDHAKTLLETEISTFQFDTQLERPVAFIAAPVFKGGVVIGVVVLKMNMDGISRIVSDYRGLGETGETLVGAREGETILFLTPLRFDRAAAFRRHIAMGGPDAIPLQNAVRGIRGYGISQDYQGKRVLAVWRYLPSFRWGMVVRQDTEEAFSSIIRERTIVLIFGAGIILLVMLIALLVASGLSRPIRNLTRVAIRISEGNLSGVIPEASNHDSRSEVDILARGFSTMKSGLLDLVAGLKRATVDVRSSSTQIAAATRQLESTVTEQAASTNEVVATAKEIFATSKELAGTMVDLTSVAAQTASHAESGRQGISEMQSVIGRLVEAEEAISTRLETVRERASNISSIITTIGKVADHTNLLSLNAAIEAEKAGEAGAGFAVVATEIRRLSDQTGSAAQEIEEMIREMQSAVLAGVSSVESYSKQLAGAVKTIQDVSDQLERVIEMIQTLTPQFENVSGAMQAQSTGAEQISESMVYLSDAAQQTAESVRDLNRTIHQLDEAAQTLKTEVSRFRAEDSL